jgi:hypothetical protein
VNRAPETVLGERRATSGAARRAVLSRLIRYSAVSLVATSTSLVTLGLLVGLVGAPPTWSNVMATGVGTIPSVLAANGTAYGLLWIVQYQMLDRMLFRRPAPTDPADTPPPPTVGAVDRGAAQGSCLSTPRL